MEGLFGVGGEAHEDGFLLQNGEVVGVGAGAKVVMELRVSSGGGLTSRRKPAEKPRATSRAAGAAGWPTNIRPICRRVTMGSTTSLNSMKLTKARRPA